MGDSVKISYRAFPSVFSSETRYKTFGTKGDTLTLDSLAIVPNTITIYANGQVIDTGNYTEIPYKSKLVWRNKPAGDSLKIFYRVFPYTVALRAYPSFSTPIAPPSSNMRFKTFSVKADTLTLDSLTVVPGTITVAANGVMVDSSRYTELPFESKLVWKKKPAVDSVRISFRVFPFALANEVHHKSFAEYKKYSAGSLARPFMYNPDQDKGSIIDFGALNYNGSFSRSISVGSGQDVVLNSAFNLQLSGMVTKDVELTAAITDNNVPIQPEGNTQNLQEFDKVFIQLRKDQHKVIVGDYDLNSPTNDYFLKYARKYQGGFYSGSFRLKKWGIFKTSVAGGIVKGKYARNQLAVTDGDQGPYALTGNDGETVITVLANTEQVYVDGVKMERGADRDYTIDYNTGQVTFMPRRIITQDNRVIVEFQYSNNDFTRTGVALNTELDTKKVDLFFNFFSEQDAKNQNIQQSLTGPQRNFMAGLGDSIQKAYYPGFDSVPYNAGQILYWMKDTVLFGQIDTMFVYSTDSNKAKYTVTFSLVGQGAGDYVQSTSVANGIVYQWVAPVKDSGVIVHQGSYTPLIYLITPKFQQMYTLGIKYRINKYNTLTVEGAMSNYDPNTFAPASLTDYLGFATHLLYDGTLYTKGDSSTKNAQMLVYDAEYQFTQNKFNAIERFEAVEFARDWNLGSLANNQYTQNLLTAGVGYVWKGLGSINYHFKALLEDTIYQGYESDLDGNFSKSGFNAVFHGSYLHSTSDIGTSDFIRPKGDIFYVLKKLKGIKIGAGFDHEFNMVTSPGSDTLTSDSHIWQNYKVYMTTVDSSKNKYGIEFDSRTEQQPNVTSASFGKPFYQSESVNFTGSIKTLKNQSLNFNLTYRHAINSDSTDSNQPENFYEGRVDYSITAFRGAIRSTTLYELGDGREQKTQIEYVLDPTNQGTYVWEDINHDGIPELNEFFPRTFPTDSSYDKLAVPTPEYDAVNTNQFNEVLNLTPAAVWKNKRGIKKLASYFSALASVQITKKTFTERDKGLGSYLNPFPTASSTDTQLVAASMNSRNSIYYNRLNPKYGAQIDFNYTRSRSLLTSGFEDDVAQAEDILLRWNIYKGLNVQTTYTYGIKGDESDFYEGLQYRFTYNDINTDVGYQFGVNLRLDLLYEYAAKVNPTNIDTVGKQTAQINKLTFQARYNTVKKNTISASLSYADINYQDHNYENDQLENAMLDGLANDNNLVWSISYSQNLTKNIQLTLSYDGRMTGFISGDKSTLTPISTGRAELRALF